MTTMRILDEEELTAVSGGDVIYPALQADAAAEQG